MMFTVSTVAYFIMVILFIFPSRIFLPRGALADVLGEENFRLTTRFHERLANATGIRNVSGSSVPRGALLTCE